MPANEAAESLRTRLRTWIPYATTGIPLTLLACGGMYLFGYWRYFRIQFLDYVSISDVISRSIFDIGPWFLVLGEMFAIILFVMRRGVIRDWFKSRERAALAKLKPGDWRLHPFTQHLAMPILMIVVGTIALFGIQTDSDWITGFVFAVPFYVSGMAAIVNLLVPIFAEASDAFLFSLLFAFMPCTCYFRGRIVAEERRFGAEPKTLVNFIQTDVDDKLAKIGSNPVYVGRLGTFIFFASQDRQATYAMPASRIEVMTIYVPKK
jgi:hypothetical protein